MITVSRWTGFEAKLLREALRLSIRGFAARLGVGIRTVNKCEVPRILEEAAKFGCDIRILLLDPEYHGIFDIDADEGSPPGTLASRIRSALARFQQISKVCDKQMQIRVYNAPPTVSIVRGDDRMLVTPYLRFFVGSNSPSFELQYAGEMFDRYTKHFQSTWNLAKDCVE